MGNKDTVRAKFRRIAKEQWLKDIHKMQAQLADFAAEYAEGSDANQKQSLEMVMLSLMLEEYRKGIMILLAEI